MAETAMLNRFLVRPVVGAFLSEVQAYFHADGQAREAATAAVADAVRRYRPDVVLAHSLGSVVAYEALHAEPDLRVGLLLTLGSPLALPRVIFDRLRPAPIDGRGSRPRGAARWVNIADPGDIVAVPRPFTRRFQPDENWDDTHIHRFDFHTAPRYLASPRTAQAIVALMT
jgi:hypothetical protein